MSWPSRASYLSFCFAHSPHCWQASIKLFVLHKTLLSLIRALFRRAFLTFYFAPLCDFHHLSTWKLHARGIFAIYAISTYLNKKLLALGISASKLCLTWLRLSDCNVNFVIVMEIFLLRLHNHEYKEAQAGSSFPFKKWNDVALAKCRNLKIGSVKCPSICQT